VRRAQAVHGRVTSRAPPFGTLRGLPDLFTPIEHATASLGGWLYVVVAAVVLLETSVGLGLLSPGEIVLAVAGAAAADDGIHLALLLAVVGCFGVLGDTIAWALGRRYGHALLVRLGARVGVTAARLARVEDMYVRRGGWILIGGRFVGIVRVFAPFVAGSAAMPYRRFLPFDMVGIAIWGSGYVLAGYLFAGSLQDATGRIGQIGLVLGVVTAIVTWRFARASRSAAAPGG
jgi:undecaprenyl-diphosphatase